MKVEGDLPDYPGFEKDVYNTVTGYFQGLKEPLLTYSMYEVFTNVFGKNIFLSIVQHLGFVQNTNGKIEIMLVHFFTSVHFTSETH